MGAKAGIATGSAVVFCLVGAALVMMVYRAEKKKKARAQSLKKEQEQQIEDRFRKPEMEAVERPDLKPPVEVSGHPYYYTGYGSADSELGPAELL